MTTHMMEETSKSTHHKRRTFQTIAPNEDMGTKNGDSTNTDQENIKQTPGDHERKEL